MNKDICKRCCDTMTVSCGWDEGDDDDWKKGEIMCVLGKMVPVDLPASQDCLFVLEQTVLSDNNSQGKV